MSPMLQVSLRACLPLQSFAALDFILTHTLLLQDKPRQERVSPGFLCFSLSALMLLATELQHRGNVVRTSCGIWLFP